MPDAAPVSLKFFKLIRTPKSTRWLRSRRFAHSNSEEFPSARPSQPSGRHFLRGQGNYILWYGRL